VVVMLRTPGAMPRARRVLGVVAGMLATSLGFPIAAVTLTLVALSAFWPFVFIAVVLEAIVLFAGFAAMYWLCAQALAARREGSWHP
jgi:phage shock protein PspC (stress-responsive transcriptional regulator)